MARKGSGGGWGALLFALVGLGVLYYAQTGQGKENDAALIPNDLERDIDLLIGELNNQFGERWLDWGIKAIKSHLQRTLPHLVVLVDVVSAVELQSRRTLMTSQAKKQAAVRMALAR
jgi:hypothetical protein